MILGGIVCVVAFFITLSVGKDVNATMQKHEQDEHKIEHDKQSLRSKNKSFINIHWILMIYGGAILMGAIFTILLLI